VGLHLTDAAGFVAELKESVRSIVVELEKQCPEMRNVSESCIAGLQALDSSSRPQDELQRMVQLDEGFFGGLIRASA
jgi:archaellum component FlaC